MQSDTELFQQLAAHQLDYVVWLRPLARHKSVLQKLADAGTPSAVLPEPGLTLPAPMCFTSWENAFRRALVAWQQDGITSVTLLHHPDKLDPLLMSGLARHPFRVTGLRMNALSLSDWAASQPRDPGAAVLFADDHLAEQFIARYPDVFAELARRRRVLLKTTLPADAAILQDAPVDLLEFNWRRIATTIADDIASGRLLRQKEPVTFRVKLHLRAPAARFAPADRDATTSAPPW